MSSYQLIPTINELDVYLQQSSQFKTTLLQLFIERPLDEHYSRFALLPFVLKRGTNQFPESIALARRWDDLYGASFHVSLQKMGRSHVIEMRLELANEQFVPDQVDLLTEAITTLADMVMRPALEDGLFRQDYLQQEKDSLIRAIDGLETDKGEYAHHRCIEEMYKDDPFSLFYLGSVEEIEQITAEQLYAFYQKVLNESRFCLLVTGQVSADTLAAACQAFHGLGAQASRQVVLATQKLPSGIQEVQEEDDVVQGKLVVGALTNTMLSDADYPELLVFNGIFGGYSHSKLFLNIREKHSLAYYCSSSLVPSAGLMLIEAGIATAQYDQVLKLIQENLAEMQRGFFSNDDLDKTKLTLINTLNGIKDNPERLGLIFFDRLLAGTRYSNDELVRGINDVTRKQVQAVAQKVSLDTVYFLRSCGEEVIN